ncbi:MAG TPA: hypothetical protein VHJ20_09470 [Polyangia bacterium]|nr:hypothetical protein [Polyangia bacterium]
MTEAADVHSGPSLLFLAIVYIAVLGASVVGALSIARGVPVPSTLAAEALYFTRHAAAVRWSAVLQLASSIPLGIFAATLASRLRFLGAMGAGPMIALFGGAAASIMTALAAIATGALARPEIGAASPAVVHVLHTLAEALGGPGFVVPFGLLVGGASIAGAAPGMLSRKLLVFGLVTTLLSELGAVALASSAAVPLVSMARLFGLVWMLWVGAQLPRSRAAARDRATHPGRRASLLIQQS